MLDGGAYDFWMERIQSLENTVHYHIQDLSADTEHKLLMQIKSHNDFPLQLTEQKKVCVWTSATATRIIFRKTHCASDLYRATLQAETFLT